jgi:hypothetical protein
MNNYKKGDYITVMTNQPDAHFMEMFGHGMEVDNIEPSEYVGKIKSVIDDDNYLIYIVHPTIGLRCVVNSSEILRKVSDTELSDDERKDEDDIEFLASNVYESSYVMKGETEDKCALLCYFAMNNLFPEYKISSCEQISSEYKKSDLLNCADWLISHSTNKDETFLNNLNKKRDYFKEMLKHLRFKEYYTIMVGVEDERDSDSTDYLYLFVDTRFEEVVITRDGMERARFVRSLGPEYDSVGNYISGFRRGVLTGEEYIKIDL